MKKRFISSFQRIILKCNDEESSSKSDHPFHKMKFSESTSSVLKEWRLCWKCSCQYSRECWVISSSIKSFRWDLSFDRLSAWNCFSLRLKDIWTVLRSLLYTEWKFHTDKNDPNIKMDWLRHCNDSSFRQEMVTCDDTLYFHFSFIHIGQNRWDFRKIWS